LNLLILATAPVIIILVYVYVRDKYEKEPLAFLFKALLAGMLITLPIILVNLWIEGYKVYFEGLLQVGYVAFIVAGLVEELFKFIALYLLVWHHREFNEKFDGIVYAVFISLGFAMVENIMYVYRFGETTGYLRAFTAVPAHALFGVTMGYFFGLAKFGEIKRYVNLLKALFFPVLLHGVYNFILMSGQEMYLLIFIPFMLYLWRAGFKKMKILNKVSRFKK
jgi:RsiW-degrading membrane proteinase PrsW (M82 family)